MNNTFPSTSSFGNKNSPTTKGQKSKLKKPHTVEKLYLPCIRKEKHHKRPIIYRCEPNLSQLLSWLRFSSEFLTKFTCLIYINGRMQSDLLLTHCQKPKTTRLKYSLTLSHSLSIQRFVFLYSLPPYFCFPQNLLQLPIIGVGGKILNRDCWDWKKKDIFSLS